MKNPEYEVVVIGGGSGGYAAASNLAGYGVRTVLIEKAETLGGLCILRGCMPSKAMIESANLFRRMRAGGEFGIHMEGLRVSMEEIQDRKERLVGGFQNYREDQLKNGGFDLIRGEAAFEDENTVTVDGEDGVRKITFIHAIIATGSVTSVPDIPGLKDGNFWLSRDALNTREIPGHLIIVGGGAIGCEMAHCFEGLGSEVTIIKRTGCLLSEFDDDISEEITAVSRKRGIKVHCGTSTKSVGWPKKGGVEVTIEKDGKTETISGTHLLMATGRTPATKSLALATCGVETEKARVKTNAHMQTSAPHIFAIGDTTSELPVVHEAVLQGEAVARHIAIRLGKTGGEIQASGKEGWKLFGVFTHPECARVGMSSDQIREQGLSAKSASYRFSDHGKAEILNETDGFVKIVAEKGSGRILSASAIGPHVIDLIHEMQVAIHAGMTVGELLAVPHYHPTLSEIWTYPAEELAE